MIACILITTSAFVQLLLTIWFRARINAVPETMALPAALQHSTWIVMSVRGADPTFAKAVNSLMNQSFRDYRICIVVDNERDPSAELLETIAQQADNDRLVIRQLQNPLQTCTLKCSAIAEGIEYVLQEDSDVKYFVMVDSDSLPPDNMMSTLLSVLDGEETVGLACGNQWFEPDSPASTGSIVRSMWYAGALFFSIVFENPWAGVYAMRAEDIRKTGLLDVWRRSAVDDGPLKAHLASHGLRCKSLPAMVVINREDCSLAFATRWMSRILTWSRIHEPAFWLTFLQMAFSTLLIIGLFANLAYAIACANLQLLMVCISAAIASGLLSVLAWTTIRRAVMETSDSSVGFRRVAPTRFLSALLILTLTHGVYTVACLAAILTKSVKWRGVSYKIKGRSLSLEEYLPYEKPNSGNQSI